MDVNLAKRNVRRPTDRYGQRITQFPDPDKLRVRRVPDSIRDRASLNNVLSNVTPARLVSIFNEADNGYIGPQIELAQTIEERDTHVQSLLQTRRLAVETLDYIVEPGAEDEAAGKAADEFRLAWERLDTRELFDTLLAALNQQWAIVNVIWDTEAVIDGRRAWRPVGFREVDARRLVWPIHDGDKTDPDDVSVIVPGISLDWSMTNTVPIEPGAFIAHSFRDKDGRPGRGAPVRAIAFWWMVKRFASIDWATLSEQFGKPWRVVKHDPNATQTQIAAILSTLREAAADLCIAIPVNAEVQLVEGMRSGEAPQAALARFCDEQNSKAIIGTTTIADAAANNESVSSPTHGDVRRVIRDADAWSLATTIRRDLIVPWTLWNYGANVAAPQITPNLENKPDPASRSAIYQAAAQLGLRVKTDQLYGDLGIEQPEGLPEVITLRPIATGTAADVSGAPDSNNIAFQRDVVKAFLADRTVNDVMFNLTDARKLFDAAGIPKQPDYEEPWLPVRDETGALVSGDVIKDETGDIVGGDVEPGTAPQQASAGFGSMFGGPPKRQDAKADDAADDAAVETDQKAEVLPGLVLNGAQIQAATAIVTAVAAGDLPRDAGLGQLQVLFNLTPEQANQIMGSAGTSRPTTPNPKPGQDQDLTQSRQDAKSSYSS